MFQWSRTRYLIKSEQGFLLVEVMISVLILAFVTVGTLATFAKCSIFVGGIREHSIVNNALNERMEEVRDTAYASITTLPSTFLATGFDELKNPVGTQVIDDPFTDNDIKRITLTVTWNTQNGRAMTKSMAAYITNSGINRQ